uniref:uncharacterized protein LOC108950503 n=1 Tax=Ciona intestinalis TaxID=7719 RepID=UPI000EF55132|nr:uncharacterized protein LOC108950503 [Ciona intestinalis]|eukprot:XP_026695119.1 uncharacterized protein LOC108950503 [Ciona intestinalis]
MTPSAGSKLSPLSVRKIAQIDVPSKALGTSFVYYPACKLEVPPVLKVECVVCLINKSMASNTKAFEDSSKHNNTASCSSSSEYGSTDDPAASDATVSGHDRTDSTPSLDVNLRQTFENNDCTNSTPLRHLGSIPPTDVQYHDVRPVNLQLKGGSTTIVTLRITNGERVYVNKTLGFSIEPICPLNQGSEGCRVMIYGLVIIKHIVGWGKMVHLFVLFSRPIW